MVKQKLQADAKETVNTRSEETESRADSAHDTHRIVAVNGTSSMRLSPTTERNGQLVSGCLQDDGSAADLAGVPGRVSAASCAGSAAYSPESAPRSVHRSLMCQCLRPSINQVTKHAEFPKIYHIDKVVDSPVVMQ